MNLHRLTFAVVEWTMYFQVNTVATAYNHDKERIDLPLPLTRIEMEVP